MDAGMELEMELEMEADMEADVLTSDLTATCYGRWVRRPRCPRGWVQALPLSPIFCMLRLTY